MEPPRPTPLRSRRARLQPAGVSLDLNGAFFRTTACFFRALPSWFAVGIIVFSPLLALGLLCRGLGGIGWKGTTLIYYSTFFGSKLAGVLLAAPVSVGVAEYYEKRPVRLRAMLKGSARCWRDGLPVVFLVTMLVGVAFAICILPALLLFLQATTRQRPEEAFGSIRLAAIAGAFLGLTCASAVWARLAAAIPAALVERLATHEAIRRSRELTQVSHVNIAILGGAGILLCMVTEFGAGALFTNLFPDRSQLWIRLVAAEMVCILPAAWFAILGSVIHQQLTRAEAGHDVARVTRIFE
jgi:hypothetical protein